MTQELQQYDTITATPADEKANTPVSQASVAISDADRRSPQLSRGKRFFGHLHTITKHKWLVCKLCFKAGLYKQGLTHDLSKYSPTEFWPGVKYYQGWRSPNAMQRELFGYSSAWLHHKGRNKHHFEYWMDLVPISPEDPYKAEWGCVPMPPKYLVEMLCDRMAASMVYQGEKYTQRSALDYYHRELSVAPHMMAPETARQLEHFLHVLAEQGEEAVFTEARAYLAAAKQVAGDSRV